MPRFDGTGPLGKGPMTGQGNGYCIIKTDKDNPGNRGELQKMEPEQELYYLKRRASYVQESLNSLNKRISELENHKEKE